MVPSPMRPTQSEAERYLYLKFERELPADVVVVHGARWVGDRHGRRGEDGEADFVILDPHAGILVLEAKSGAVRRDGPSGKWFQSGGGAEHEIRSPMEQASASKHALRALLESMPVVASRRLHLVDGIALPFHTVSPAGLGPDVPRSRILDANALRGVAAFVRGALESADPRRSDLPDLGADGVDRVVDALTPRRAVRAHLGTLSEAMGTRLLRLTEEQFQVLDWLAATRRGYVRGGPGTGKTLLAQELARRFAVQGLDVLLVCFNGPLAGRLEAFASEVPGIAATTFHEMCRARARAVGLGADVEEARQAPDGYDRGLPELLLEAAGRSDRRHDVIVVDEAQDFEAHWWIALEAWLAAGKAGRLYAFGDETQSLYGRDGTPPAADLGLAGPFPLTRNCRNTDEICAVLEALAPPGDAAHRSGVVSDRRPRITWAATLADVRAATGRIVDRLLAGGVAPRDLAVLTPRSQGRSVIGATGRLGRAEVSWRDRASDAHVLVDTIHRFKGLESAAIVVTELDPEGVSQFERLLRVGFSRAQSVLEVVATPAARAVLAPALAAFDEGGRVD